MQTIRRLSSICQVGMDFKVMCSDEFYCVINLDGCDQSKLQIYMTEQTVIISLIEKWFIIE